MESRDQRIITLATTLKSSGIAKTDSQAKMMAEEMIGVEEHVQKSYEEEHERANEYLQTAKNLRIPEPASASELAAMPSSSEQKITPSKLIEPLASKSQPSQSLRSAVSDSSFESVNDSDSLNFKTSNRTNESSDHNTHNSALEAIKSQIQKEDIIPLEDQMQPTQSESLVSDVQSVISEDDAVASELTESTIVPEEVVIDNKLDAKKLVELMEEDGKLEEHTREIKEPVKNAKPKEEYAENNIDLSNVFSFNKK